MKPIRPLDFSDMNQAPDLKSHRIGNSSDVIAHFQAQLDLFPIGMFSEFAAVMVGDAQRVDRLVFPETVIAIPDSDHSLTNYSATTFPQLKLMSDANTNELYLKIITHRLNKDHHIESLFMILSMDEALFISDIWDSIAFEDKITLGKIGFGSNMPSQQWAEGINKYLSHISPAMHPHGDDEIMLRELPMLIARRGVVGTNGSYHLLPEFMLYAMQKNSFVFGKNALKPDPVFNFGNIHIHSLVNEMDPLQQEVAKIVGADVVRRNPSGPDIMHQRASQSIFKKVSLRYGNRSLINAMYTFGGIITVDADGGATGIRWLDLYKKGLDVPRLIQLNDATMKTMDSANPDPRIIAEQYMYVDSITTEELPPYVGS